MFDWLKTLPAVLGKALGLVKETGEAEALKTMNRVAVLLGKAFGPAGIQHYSELPMIEQARLLSRVKVLQTNHADWPEALRWIPRTVTTWVGLPPVIIDGNTQDPKPIPDRGKWYVARGFFTMTTEDGIHIRFGFRYDDVDGYYSFPSFTVKKFANH